jgi:hypothetical protein
MWHLTGRLGVELTKEYTNGKIYKEFPSLTVKVIRNLIFCEFQGNIYVSLMLGLLKNRRRRVLFIYKVHKNDAREVFLSAVLSAVRLQIITWIPLIKN